MKINIIPAFLAASLLILFSSCEKAVTNVDLPDSKPKLVVYSYLSPGADTIFAEISFSRPINQPSYPALPVFDSAEINITEIGGQTVNLQFNPDFRYFYAEVEDSFLKQNSQYRLYAKTPGGYEVDAVCELPVKNSSLRLLEVDSTRIDEILRYRFKVGFDDIIGKPDYYRLMAKATVRRDWEGDTSVYEYDLGFNYGEQYIAVKDRDGETFIVDTQVEIWPDFYWGNEKLLGIRFYLLSTDENYYQFHNSLQNYVPDNPFSEPTIIYSNVNNGLGVVAGYNAYLLEYWLEEK